MAAAAFKLPPNIFRLGLAVAGLAGVGVGLKKSLYTIEGGHEAVTFNQLTGAFDRYGEGTHFLIPWVQVPFLFDLRKKIAVKVAQTGSKDLQMVRVTLRILHYPDRSALPEIVKTLGLDPASKVLPSIANEVLGGTIAEFTAAQLITQRARVSVQIRDKLRERAENFHLILDDVSITHVDFAPEYIRAVEEKQIAQQQEQRAKFTVEKAREQKEEIIVKAEQEAQAAREFNSALLHDRSGSFLAIRRLQAARDIAEIVASGGNRVYLSADNLLFNVLGGPSAAQSRVVA